MSIALDIIFGFSKQTESGHKAYIGLTSTLHQKTRSKELVNLFYHAGHCLSYDSLLKIDSTLANDTLTSLDKKSGAVIPQNLVPGRFIHFSADNIDIKDESLDGKNMFHATQMAAYQRSDGESIIPFSHINKISKNKTLQVPEVLTQIEKISINVKLTPIIRYPVTVDSFTNSEIDDSQTNAKAADNAFCFIRQDMPNRIGWTEFNQQSNTDCPSESTIGHMPMILAPAHEYDTLNLVVRRCMAVSTYFKQQYTIITVDQALFCKLHVLISNIPEFQHKVFPRLGGLHISLNFQRIIGQHMSGCGLYEAWIESNILGEVGAQKVLAGKSYSKAMRAHKITLQALWRIFIPKLMKFLSCKNSDMVKHMNCELQKYKEKEITDTDIMFLLQKDEWKHYLSTFVQQESDKSVNFSFWWKYMEIISLLLMFTRAQRNGI